jgi:hypothetical protein
MVGGSQPDLSGGNSPNDAVEGTLTGAPNIFFWELIGKIFPINNIIFFWV